MNRQIYKMTLSDASDSITFYLLEVPIADDDITGTARNTTIDGNVYEDYLWLKKQWSQKWSIMCKDEYDKLRGIWKRQYTDSEVVSVKYFYGDNIYTDGEVEGNTMQINNDSEVYEGEIRGFSLYGNATQTTYTGKNLMPILNIERTINNVKFTPQADGSVLVNGTNNTANYAVYVLTFNTAEYNVYRTVPAVAGTYYISNEGTIPSGVYVQCFTQITGQSVIQHNADGVFTVAENFNFGCAIRVDAGTTVNNLIIKPMVEKTTTKTTWEPYVGSTSSAITPSPNPDYPQEIKTVSGEQTVNIAGKNLLDPTPINPNVYHFAPTTSIYYYDANLLYRIEAGKTYTLSLKMDELSSQDAFAFSVGIGTTASYRHDVNYVGNITDISQRIANTFTVSQADIDQYGDILWMRCPRYSTARVFSYTLSNIQLELSNAATAYEPYQAQNYSINLGGTNLLDISGSAEQSGTTLKFEDNEVKASGTASASMTFTLINGIKYAQTYWQTLKPNDTNSILLPKGTYYFSGTYSIATTSVQYRLVDDGDTMENGTSVSLNSSFTVSSPKRFCIAVYVNNGNTPSGSFKLPQLNKGSTALPYAPYTDYAYELAKIGTYQDYIWNDNGTWKIHKEVGKVVLDGTEDGWGMQNNCFRRDFSDALQETVGYINILVISDNFTGRTTCYRGDIKSGQCAKIVGANQQVAFGYDALNNDVDAWKTWLSTHNTTVYYALATPTDTEITDAELVGQLEALLAGSLYKGLNNVFLIPSAGADGTMTLDYRIDYEKETVVQIGW